MQLALLPPSPPPSAPIPCARQCRKTIYSAQACTRQCMCRQCTCPPTYVPHRAQVSYRVGCRPSKTKTKTPSGVLIRTSFEPDPLDCGLCPGRPTHSTTSRLPNQAGSVRQPKSHGPTRASRVNRASPWVGYVGLPRPVRPTVSVLRPAKGVYPPRRPGRYPYAGLTSPDQVEERPKPSSLTHRLALPAGAARSSRLACRRPSRAIKKPPTAPLSAHAPDDAHP